MEERGKKLKLSGAEMAVVLLTAVFLAFTAGWFLRGEQAAEPLRVETQRRLEAAVTALPAPAVTSGNDLININTADAETLQRLPGIGEKRAADIVADREANGLYRYPEDITRVSGIGEETLAGLIDQITTGEESE
ncbi:MAG: ComEA family DNA-binding protein [Pseudoflavonifractor sp.]|nr:ComEA family DNA-binding protein [Pseudoflavonifractor sp.]